MALPSNEELAEYVKQVQSQSVEAENQKGRNYMLPAPPQPGEYIKCRICGKVMLPENFSKDPHIRKREFKWQIHWECQQHQFDLCDLQTPGLIAERKKGLRAGRQFPQQRV